jgi:outer membrane protein insertion porin family
LEYSYPLTEFQRLILGITWNDAELLASSGSTVQAQDWVQGNGNPFCISLCELPAPGTFGTQFDTFELVTGWVYDSRNRALFADRGSRQRLLLGATVPGSDVEYYTLTYNFRKYVPLSRYFTLSLNADLRYGESFGATTSIPPYKNSFGGGPDSVRGYRENSLGPRDSFGNPYGGNLLVAGQSELILPIPGSWQSRARVTAFFDIGNVYSTDDVIFYNFGCNQFALDFPNNCTEIKYDFDSTDLKRSYGVAVQWLAPLGLFRFSYAFPMNGDDAGNPITDPAARYGDDTERFQFSIGGAF